MPWSTLTTAFSAGMMLLILALALFIYHYDQKYSLPRAYTKLSFWLYFVMGEVLLTVGLEAGVIGMLRDGGLIPQRFSSAAVMWLIISNVALFCGGLLAGSIAFVLDVRLLRRRQRDAQ